MTIDATAPESVPTDVVVVGCGPVGLCLAIALGNRGHRVDVVERWPTPYPLPRAVHFDHEVGRILAGLGIGDTLRANSEPAEVYEWRNAEGVALLFGCSSFAGVDPAAHADAFAALATRHLAPERLRPGPALAERVALRAGPHDARRALAQMPPLLRTYLAMGGWVSDHAVIDRDLGTIHVCTGVEIAAIPAVRARLLRADAV